MNCYVSTFGYLLNFCIFKLLRIFFFGEPIFPNVKCYFMLQKIHAHLLVSNIQKQVTRGGLRLQRRCFPVSFAKFLGRPFFREHLRWLLLAEAAWSFKRYN